MLVGGGDVASGSGRGTDGRVTPVGTRQAGGGPSDWDRDPALYM